MKNCKHCGIELGPTRNGLQCQTCRNGLARYKMTRNDMIQMHESQDGKCALCDKPVNMFDRRKSASGYIDHDHGTGKVRAVLCHPCNTSIGYIEKKLDINRILNYLSP